MNPSRLAKAAMRRLSRSAERDTREREPKEKPARFYDELFAESTEYGLPYTRSRYYFVWTVIVDRLRRAGVRRVLEVGCGSGQLAEFLVDQGIAGYVGLDFSEVAIGMAKEKQLSRAEFFMDDARTTGLFDLSECDAIICTEVLEHIEDDILVVSRFPAKCRCICTVPNFPWRGHVRHFETENAVEGRYGRYFEGFDVFTLRRPDSETSRYYVFEGTRNSNQREAV